MAQPCLALEHVSGFAEVHIHTIVRFCRCFLKLGIAIKMVLPSPFPMAANAFVGFLLRACFTAIQYLLALQSHLAEARS